MGIAVWVVIRGADLHVDIVGANLTKLAGQGAGDHWRVGRAVGGDRERASRLTRGSADEDDENATRPAIVECGQEDTFQWR
jgi:hypothetical protein